MHFGLTFDPKALAWSKDERCRTVEGRVRRSRRAFWPHHDVSFLTPDRLRPAVVSSADLLSDAVRVCAHVKKPKTKQGKHQIISISPTYSERNSTELLAGKANNDHNPNRRAAVGWGRTAAFSRFTQTSNRFTTARFFSSLTWGGLQGEGGDTCLPRAGREVDVQQRQDPGAPDGKHVGGQAEEGEDGEDRRPGLHQPSADLLLILCSWFFQVLVFTASGWRRAGNPLVLGAGPACVCVCAELGRRCVCLGAGFFDGDI